MTEPISSVARYRVKAGHEDEFIEIVDKHWTTLRDLDLVTDREPEVYVGLERDGSGPLLVEIFDWADEDASRRAHTHPLVSGIWEAMGPLCEQRNERPPFDFVNLRRLTRQ
jgi:hypothetical protein